MKKKLKILLLSIFCMFIFKHNLYALEPTITCPLEVNINTVFECEITTDIDVNIVSSLMVYKGSTQVNKDSIIKFKSSEEGIFDISLLSLDYTNTYNTTTVNIKNTTTKTTTKTKSNNNYLSSISIDGEKIDDFSKDKTKYFINVSYDTLKVVVDAKVEDTAAKYEVNGPKTLEVGENEYTIGVTSEDDVTKFYKVIITREEKEESSNTKINNIKIKGYKLNFDGNSKTYHLTIKKDVSKLKIDILLDDKNANYEINGNDNLKDGSIIKITVTAENQDSSTYRIIITKEQENNYLIYMLIGGSILLIIIVILNKKKNNKKEENIDNDKLEKTLTISNANENINKINSDELEKTKVMNLEKEIEKVFDDNEL